MNMSWSVSLNYPKARQGMHAVRALKNGFLNARAGNIDRSVDTIREKLKFNIK